MTEITALVATMKATAEKAKHAGEAQIMPFDTRVAALNEFQLAACPANVLALIEAQEKAQAINAAAEKLVRCKGRYHSEQNYRALAALFSVTVPELPPLESESRTVTVKLPERYSCELGYPGPDPDGELLDRNDVIDVLRAAGIQVIEGEGQCGAE